MRLGERRVLRLAKAGLAESEVMHCSTNRDAGTQMYPVCKPHFFLCVGKDGAMHISYSRDGLAGARINL